MKVKANSRIGDISVGICSVGATCCPHAWVSYHIKGSPNIYTNRRSQMRTWDIGVSTCPHCPISFALSGTSTVVSNKRRTHRKGDIHIVPCGTGIAITGSRNVLSGG